MSEPASFPDAIRGIASALRQGGRTHGDINRASVAIDHLGRRLHGLGYVRGREIADCFTAALAALDASHGVPEEKRGDGVERAAASLDAAADHATAGVLPDPPR